MTLSNTFSIRSVALSKIKSTLSALEEFENQLYVWIVCNTIGMLNHKNLIDMWGYCVEGKNRLLVYEYMEHGSLVENLCSNSVDWNKRFKIVVATTKGFAYLLEEFGLFTQKQRK
ncbi:tyrosine kinase family protein [Medicago truncatula]|uniref:Tyrosine kinase family protein n=1 Tax=Medicago truncatula TaxID=3880 RepID=G7IWU4_MEDTR|nr:tyrosine kinase family protein [Medicago truncatula]